MNIEIFDNYLNKEEFNKIRNIFIDNEKFPWYYTPGIAYPNEVKQVDKFQFFNLMYRNDVGVKSDYYDNLMPLLSKINPKEVLRVKANLGTRTTTNIEGGMHTDSKMEHTTAIFYLNTNNGFTAFENGDKVDSLENRLVVFNSTILHSGFSQTDTNIRVVLNLNYIESKYDKEGVFNG
jgi:hypothetical protein